MSILCAPLELKNVSPAASAIFTEFTGVVVMLFFGSEEEKIKVLSKSISRCHSYGEVPLAIKSMPADCAAMTEESFVLMILIAALGLPPTFFVVKQEVKLSINKINGKYFTT
jgi:hypothetical protein